MSYKEPLFTKGTQSYKDLDLSFLANPSTSDLRVKKDVDAIKQSMKILLFTNFGEKPFKPTFGGNLSRKLFEPLDRITTYTLTQSISMVLNQYEPRIKVLDVIVEQNQAEQTQLDVEIRFRLRNGITVEKLKVMLGRTR